MLTFIVNFDDLCFFGLESPRRQKMEEKKQSNHVKSSGKVWKQQQNYFHFAKQSTNNSAVKHKFSKMTVPNLSIKAHFVFLNS